MAEIFAISLLRKRSLAELNDPHCGVWIDGSTRFTLHELLCELRSLSWFDARFDARQKAAGRGSQAAASRTGLCPGGPQGRRALRWNKDGQLTLRTLFRAGVALRDQRPELSTFWRTDHGLAEPGPGLNTPGPEAPMSAWVDWCAAQSGAGLRLPGLPVRLMPVGGLEEMSACLHALPPGRPFHNAALAALSRNATWDKGLPDNDDLWRGTRLMALMAEAEARVATSLIRQAGHPERLARPAVTAARMTVWLAHEEHSEATEGMAYRAAAEELRDAAPNLVDWVSLANETMRGTRRFQTNLFLPLASPDQQRFPPSDCALHVGVAGALATLLKAVFDTSRGAQVQMVGTCGPELALAREADRMASNVALARVATGGYFPCENHQHLRLGQGIALQLLRETLQADNRSAELSFADFDGRQIQVQANPRLCGHGLAELRADGETIAWPQEAAPPAAHLTAVV